MATVRCGVLAVGVALLVAGCGGGGTSGAKAAPSRKVVASAKPSPSPACPSEQDVINATSPTGGGGGYGLTRRGVMACERGYAAAEVMYPGAGTNVVVLHLTGGTWKTLVMGSDVCSGEGDDGRSRPSWMVGVPDSVVKAAHCQPDFYKD